MKKIVTLFMLSFIAWFPGKGQDLAMGLIAFSSGYDSPLGIENCGDDRLFIVQKNGRVFYADVNGNKSAKPYLDISSRIFDRGGEQGLLGLAFDPDYLSNGYLYVNYTNKSKNTQISRFTVKAGNANEADTTTEKFLLEIPQPFSNHNGGCLRFGHDGYLYIGMGDGGSAGDPNNNAQNPLSFLGKMLRIDVHNGNPYAIPADNPFINNPNYLPEIWALGLRNPWKWSFDAKRGDLYIADVGQALYEELNIEPKGSKGGKNYGWRCYEGRHEYNTTGCSSRANYTFPVIEYTHDNGDCSITGGFVYRGTKYPRMVAKYFYTDYCSGFIRAAYLDGFEKKVKVVYKGDMFSYTAFGEDKNNELYITNYTNGRIYRLADNAIPQGKELPLKVYPSPSTGSFAVEFNAEKAGVIMLNLYNNNGITVVQQKVNAVEGKNVIRVSAPAGSKGVFNIQLIGGETYETKNILIR